MPQPMIPLAEPPTPLSRQSSLCSAHDLLSMIYQSPNPSIASTRRTIAKLPGALWEGSRIYKLFFGVWMQFEIFRASIEFFKHGVYK